MPDVAGLPVVELGLPGEQRDRLARLAAAGVKTATTALEVHYRMDGEPVPQAGHRARLEDTAGALLGVVEVTRVDVVPLGEVGDDVARAEGEGFAEATAWRAGHEEFWARWNADVAAYLGRREWSVSDEDLVVVEWFVVRPVPAERTT